MAVHSPFKLPNEVLASSIFAQYPGREQQVNSLATLLSPCFKPPKNIVLYGLEATGKSSITASVLSALCSATRKSTTEEDGINKDVDRRMQFALVKSAECITGRHLLETAVGAVARAVGWKGSVSRCENLAQLAVEIGRLLDGSGRAPDLDKGEFQAGDRFVLVFDGIDRQRDAPPTMLPALARMGEIIPSLTTVFIVTSPRPHFLHTSGVLYIHFPAYTKAEALQILSLHALPIYESTPAKHSLDDDKKVQKEMKDMWMRFCSAVWDTLSKHSGRDVISLRNTCNRLWPSFTAPLRDGTYTTKDFGRLLVSKRSLFQDELVLVPSIVSGSTSNRPQPTQPVLSSKEPNGRINHQTAGIATQLPFFSRLLLIAAYLASYTAARNDQLLFTKSHSKSRRKKGGGAASRPRARVSKHRKISAKLLGPQSFVLERMLAIFHTVRIDASTGRAGEGNWSGATADIPMAIGTLASLRLLVRTSAIADPLDASTKWKVNVGWEVVRGVARSVGVELEDFIVD